MRDTDVKPPEMKYVPETDVELKYFNRIQVLLLERRKMDEEMGKMQAKITDLETIENVKHRYELKSDVRIKELERQIKSLKKEVVHLKKYISNTVKPI